MYHVGCNGLPGNHLPHNPWSAFGRKLKRQPSPDLAQYRPWCDPYVGKVKHFLTNVPPWALGNLEERQVQAVKLLDADWFEYVGRNTNALPAPVFSKRNPSDAMANL